MNTTTAFSIAIKRTSTHRWLLGALLFAGLATSVTPAAAHPVHATLAEVEWDPQTKRYEVALQFTVTDLEIALTVDEKKPVRLTETKESAHRAATFVNKHFYALRSGQRVAMDVAGIELGPKVGWLYFTWDAGGDRINIIRSDLFFGAAESQLNTVVLTKRGAVGEAKRESHSFTERRPGAWVLKK